MFQSRKSVLSVQHFSRHSGQEPSLRESASLESYLVVPAEPNIESQISSIIGCISMTAKPR